MGHTETVDCTIDLSITCDKCENNLKVWNTATNEIRVNPCEYCIEEATQKGRDDATREIEETEGKRRGF